MNPLVMIRTRTKPEMKFCGDCLSCFADENVLSHIALFDMETVVSKSVSPDQVRSILGRHMLTDGMPIILDLGKSSGRHLYDALSGREYLDFFGFYASNAVGMNHPKMAQDSDFLDRMVEVSLNKVTNSDVYTTHLARFIRTFSRVGIPEYLPYAFFVAGGSLAVENALKAAFDWKVRKNFQKGHRREVGHKVLHFDQAFHGRSGYTLSMTNTADLRKTQYFPKFDWPRISNPKVAFPLTDERMEDLERREQMALVQARQAFAEHGDDIACVIIEPIQGEGGDNHFRREFLQAIADLAHENDALMIFDEVQTGVGISGSFWTHQAIGVEPDIIAFGKKTQVCGILAGRRLDEVEGHVFKTASRINSTWGGNIVDMVRFDRILEIIEEENLVENAERVGAHLQRKLQDVADDNGAVDNVRGRGLMCAFDLPSAEIRDRFLKRCFQDGLVILGCGTRSVRFRSPLNLTAEEVDQGVGIISEVLQKL
jgi:L-lysine 6-transaminase